MAIHFKMSERKRPKKVDVRSMIREQLMKDKKALIEDRKNEIESAKRQIEQKTGEIAVLENEVKSLEDPDWKVMEGAEETYRIMSLSVLKDGFFKKRQSIRGLKNGVVMVTYGLARKSGREFAVSVRLNVPSPEAAVAIARANGLFAMVTRETPFTGYPTPTDKNLKTYNVSIN